MLRSVLQDLLTTLKLINEEQTEMCYFSTKTLDVTGVFKKGNQIERRSHVRGYSRSCIRNRKNVYLDHPQSQHTDDFFLTI